MLKKLPSYYQKSRVIKELFKSIELEFKSLSEETVLTENQFFVILSDRDIAKHEQDVGLVPDTAADLETRRGRVMSKLRGTGTVTKTMMKNVAASFVNGDIEIIEYPSRYCFAVKFTSRTGIPYNIEDIKAHLKPYIDEYNKTAVSYKKIGILKVRTTPFPKNTLRKIMRFKIDMTID